MHAETSCERLREALQHQQTALRELADSVAEIERVVVAHDEGLTTLARIILRDHGVNGDDAS